MADQNSKNTEKTPRDDQHAPAASTADTEELEVVDQDPGARQKENQNESEDDPLAA